MNVYIVLSIQHTVMVESVWYSKKAADMQAKAMNIVHIDRTFYVEGPFKIQR